MSGKRIAETPRKKKMSKKGKQRTAVLILGAIIAVVLIFFLLIKIFVRPPDVTVDPVVPVTSITEEEKYADLEEPFIPDGDRARKDDFFTFLVCGTDNDGTRTDTMIVVSYDITTQKINMLNVPRDTISNVKRKVKKINAGFYNGPEALIEEMQMLLGIPIDRYVVVDFEGFEKLVDIIGGVEFNVPTYMVWDDPTQDLHIYLEPGVQKLDGEKAIQLVRFRQNNPGVKGGYADGDIGRIKLQQEFLQTVAKKVLSLENVMKVGDMASAITSNTKTDLSLSEILWFGMKAMKMDFTNISMDTLPGRDAYVWEPDFGHMQSYFFPDEEEILATVNAQLNPYKDPITDLKLIDASKYSDKKPN